MSQLISLTAANPHGDVQGVGLSPFIFLRGCVTPSRIDLLGNPPFTFKGKRRTLELFIWQLQK